MCACVYTHLSMCTGLYTRTCVYMQHDATDTIFTLSLILLHMERLHAWCSMCYFDGTSYFSSCMSWTSLPAIKYAHTHTSLWVPTWPSTPSEPSVLGPATGPPLVLDLLPPESSFPPWYLSCLEHSYPHIFLHLTGQC